MIVNQNQSDTNRTMSLDEFIRCCRFYFVIFVFDFVALHKAKSDAQHRSQVQDKWNGKWDQLRYWFDLFLLRTVRFVRILCFVRLAGGPFDCRRHYLSTSINCSGQETRTISAINIQLALQRLMQRHLSAWARFCHPVKSYTRQYRQWQQSDKPEIALMKPLLCNHQKLLHTKSAEWKISVFFFFAVVVVIVDASFAHSLSPTSTAIAFHGTTQRSIHKQPSHFHILSHSNVFFYANRFSFFRFCLIWSDFRTSTKAMKIKTKTKATSAKLFTWKKGKNVCQSDVDGKQTEWKVHLKWNECENVREMIFFFCAASEALK